LNRFPQLKSFLKDGEAERYINVTVTFIAGRPAIMTIYDNELGVDELGTEIVKTDVVEEIELNKINDKPKLHELFKEKGFLLKDELNSRSDVQRVDMEKTDVVAVARPFMVPYTSLYVLYGIGMTAFLLSLALSALRRSGSRVRSNGAVTGLVVTNGMSRNTSRRS
jgi:Sep15/SelM redox domain